MNKRIIPFSSVGQNVRAESFARSLARSLFLQIPIKNAILWLKFTFFTRPLNVRLLNFKRYRWKFASIFSVLEVQKKKKESEDYNHREAE
jgi:hypothetical protein